MSAVRPATPGKTRTCPHCKAVILESARICPGCQHHLRFGGDPAQRVQARTALQVEGKISHPRDEEPWEYCVLVVVRNERGQEVARHVINVGALANAEERVVSLTVDVMPPKSAVTVPQRPALGAAPPTRASPQAPPAPPRPAAAQTPPATTPPNQPLRPAKETLRPPKPGDPYPPTFGRGPRVR